MVTLIAGQAEGIVPGAKFLVDAQGLLLQGQLSEKLLALLKDPIQEVLQAKTPRLVELDLENNPRFNGQESSLRLFLDPIFSTAKLVILGGGHIAVPLAHMGKLLNYEVTVVDDRPSFANSGRFPEADHVLCQDFESAIRNLDCDNSTYIVIVTRGHRHDQTCLEGVLKKPRAAYIGMIGSRRKVETLLGNLREEGYSEEDIGRVYTPIGMDIGAQTPEEIAVSILAEIIMVNRYGYSLGLKTGRADQKEKAINAKAGS